MPQVSAAPPMRTLRGRDSSERAARRIVAPESDQQDAQRKMSAQRGGRIVVRGGAAPGRTFRDADRCRHRRWGRTGDRSHVGRRRDFGRAERTAVAMARVVMRRVLRRAEGVDLVRLADRVFVRRRLRNADVVVRGVVGCGSVIVRKRGARCRLRRGGRMFMVRATADDGMPKHARGGDDGGDSTQHGRVDRAGAAEVRPFSTYTDRRGEAQYRPGSGAAAP